MGSNQLNQLLDLEDAKTILQTRSKGFRVHHSILAAISPVFRAIVPVDSRDPSMVDEDGSPLQEIFVDEAPADLDLLIRLIFPVIPPPKFEDFDSLSRTFEILQKYKVEGVKALIRPTIMTPPFLASDPVRVYAMATRFGFKEEAAVAAPLAAATDFTMGIHKEDLDRMSAPDYHRLVVLNRERLEKSKSDIFSTPLQCTSCPQAFYVLFRQKLGEKLTTEKGGKFWDTMECLDVCFTIAKECGASSCSGVDGAVHFEKFVLELVKRLQQPPTYVY